MNGERERRRLAILAEGEFGEIGSKTAMGVIRYGPDDVVAVLDSTKAGRNVAEWLPDHDVPIVGTIEDALARAPTALLLGTAPPGGKLPPAWRRTVLAAIEHGLDVLSGLHTFLRDDEELAAAAARHRATIIDYRRPPERLEVASGRPHAPGKRVILTVGTDCALGKMSVALELRAAALAAGLPATFVPTGQTGIMIEGWGVAVDRVISDFLNGTCEWLVEQAEARGDWIFVEGQGSLDHPAYSAVTLGLIHGTRPDAMVLVHEVGRVCHHGWEDRDSRLKDLATTIRVHEVVAGLVAPSRVAAVALNTRRLGDDDAQREIERVATETGLPTDDPYRFGADRLVAALRQGLR